MMKKSALLLTLLLLASCSKEATKNARTSNPGDSESYPIENAKMKNCRFKDPNPTYAFGSTIAPNPIICDEGVAKKVERLTVAQLPSGIEFSQNTLSLQGIANERVIQAPYTFYLENEAGYVIVKIQISIQ